MDEVQKPDISAPGEDIISSFSSFSSSNILPVATTQFQGKEYEFIRRSGTSMSAPMVTGAVALILEADPGLSPAQVKELLITSAREDELTGMLPPEGDLRWGHGKLDVYSAIQELLTTSITPIHHTNGFVYPNPARNEIHYAGKLFGDEQFELVSQDGKSLGKGGFTGSVYITHLPDGYYLLRVSGASLNVTLPFVVKH